MATRIQNEDHRNSGVRFVQLDELVGKCPAGRGSDRSAAKNANEHGLAARMRRRGAHNLASRRACIPRRGDPLHPTERLVRCEGGRGSAAEAPGELNVVGSYVQAHGHGPSEVQCTRAERRYIVRCKKLQISQLCACFAAHQCSHGRGVGGVELITAGEGLNYSRTGYAEQRTW
jgi:hypothetical protein